MCVILKYKLNNILQLAVNSVVIVNRVINHQNFRFTEINLLFSILVVTFAICKLIYVNTKKWILLAELRHL